MHVIFNPEAGGLRRHPGHFQRTLSLLREKWPEVQTIATEGPQTAGPIAARCVEQESGLILIAGGDGTINEALAGVAGSSVPLGILPFGNANVLANEWVWAITRCAPPNCCRPARPSRSLSAA